MVSRFAPPAVFLWAQLPIHAQSQFITELPRVRPAPRIVLGGPGWDDKSGAGARSVASLSEAVDEITLAIGA
jgi:hypothetical protein